MSEIREKLRRLESLRLPLLVLLGGVLLMLLPGRSVASPSAQTDPGTQLQELLSSAEGIGEARVIVSDKGVVVVCRGADDAAVRLEVLRAVSTYTGFGSDRITVLKLAQSRS